jgi:hypothetical protein
MSAKFMIKPSVLAIAAVFVIALSSSSTVFAAATDDKELEHQMRQSDGGHPRDSELKGVKQPKPSEPTPETLKRWHDVEHGLRESDSGPVSHDHDPVPPKPASKEKTKAEKEFEHQQQQTDGAAPHIREK